MTPALLPVQGRQRNGPRQGAQTAPPPPPPPPRPRRPASSEAHNPEPGRGEWGPGRPPPEKTSQKEHETAAGHAEGHGPAPSTRAARGARATPTQGGQRAADDARARAHAHAKDTRGIPERKPNEARGTHRPHGMVYQASEDKGHPDGTARHTQRENRGAGGGGAGKTQSPTPAPTPLKRPQAPGTHDQGTAPAQAVVAHRATHQPHR